MRLSFVRVLSAASLAVALLVAVMACGEQLSENTLNGGNDGGPSNPDGNGNQDGTAPDGSITPTPTQDGGCSADSAVAERGCGNIPTEAGFKSCDPVDAVPVPANVVTTSGTIKASSTFVSAPASLEIELQPGPAFVFVVKGSQPIQFNKPTLAADIQLVEIGSRVEILRLDATDGRGKTQRISLMAEPTGDLTAVSTLNGQSTQEKAASPASGRLCIGAWSHVRMRVVYQKMVDGGPKEDVTLNVQIDGSPVVSPSFPSDLLPGEGNASLATASFGLARTGSSAIRGRLDNLVFYLE